MQRESKRVKECQREPKRAKKSQRAPKRGGESSREPQRVKESHREVKKVMLTTRVEGHLSSHFLAYRTKCPARTQKESG